MSVRSRRCADFRAALCKFIEEVREAMTGASARSAADARMDSRSPARSLAARAAPRRRGGRRGQDRAGASQRNTTLPGGGTPSCAGAQAARNGATSPAVRRADDRIGSPLGAPSCSVRSPSTKAAPINSAVNSTPTCPKPWPRSTECSTLWRTTCGSNSRRLARVAAAPTVAQAMPTSAAEGSTTTANPPASEEAALNEDSASEATDANEPPRSHAP